MKKIPLLLLLSALLLNLAEARQSGPYNLNTGDVFEMVSVMDQEIVQNIMGTDQTITNIITTKERFEVTDVSANEISFMSTISAMKTELGTPMGDQTFDSEGSSPNDIVMKAMTGKSYEFKISGTGTILEVSGLQALRDSINSELTGTPFAGMGQEVSAGYSEEAVMTALAGVFSFYPKEPADQWSELRTLVFSGTPVELEINYTLEEDDTITMTSKIDFKGETDQMGAKVDINLSGLQKGSITVDPETGMITTSTSTGDVAGFAMTQGMEIPIAVTTNSKTTITKL